MRGLHLREIEERRPESGITLDNLIELLSGFGVLVSVHQRESVVRLHDRRERVQSQREAELLERFVEMIRRHQIIEGVKIVRVSVVWIQFDRTAKLRLHSAPFPGGGQRIATRHMRVGAAIVQLHSFSGRLIRQLQGLLRRNQTPVACRDHIAIRKPCPRIA